MQYSKELVYMKIARSLFSLVLVLVLCLGLFVPQFQAAYTYETVTTLQTGDYAMVLTDIAPSGYWNGSYYVTKTESNNPGLLFASFSSAQNAVFWRITRVSGTKCTIQNTQKGDKGYLNIFADTLQYGSYQELNYKWVTLENASEPRCMFYREIGGEKYYIRFTNSSQNESRFHAGTSDSDSARFRLYCRTEIETSDGASQPKPAGKPLLTLACIADGHVDYGLQSQSPYMRNAVIKTLNRIGQEEDADLLLVGGDSTSDNDDTPEPGEWTESVYQRVVDAYADAVDVAIDSGRSLWASGNHDCEAGQYYDYDSYAGFVELMQKTCGTPLSVYRQKDDPTVSNSSDPAYIKNYVMGLHYNVEGFDFLILNAPHMGDDQLSSGTVDWFEKRMKSIGSSKTVFLICHYSLNDSRGMSRSDYGLNVTDYAKFKQILLQYPNLIYLYGHNHGSSSIPAYITSDTFQRITFYTSGGSVVSQRNAVPQSFISCFMGSMGYYLAGGVGLTAADPSIVQALMIYVYEDRIVFQMKNYGTGATNTLEPWTVMRDVKSTLPDNSSTDDSQNSTNTSSNSSQGSSTSTKPNSSTSAKPNSSTSKKPNSSTSAKPNSSSSSKPTSSGTKDPVGADTTDIGTPDNSSLGTVETTVTTDVGSNVVTDSSLPDSSESLQSTQPDTSDSGSVSQDSENGSQLPLGAWIGIIGGSTVTVCGGVIGAGVWFYRKRNRI